MADDLAADARKLSQGVERLSGSVQQLAERTQRSERLIIGLAVALVAILLVAGVVAVMAVRMSSALDCQSRQNAAVRDALTGRAAASGQQVDAAIQQAESAKQQIVDQKTFLVTLPTAAEADQQKAFVNYMTSLDVQAGDLDRLIAALKAQNSARAQNPLPAQAHC